MTHTFSIQNKFQIGIVIGKCQDIIHHSLPTNKIYIITKKCFNAFCNILLYGDKLLFVVSLVRLFYEINVGCILKDKRILLKSGFYYILDKGLSLILKF